MRLVPTRKVLTPMEKLDRMLRAKIAQGNARGFE